MRHLRAAELSLPERFYFLTHDLHGGRRLHAQAIGYGIAACLIAELVWSGWAAVERHTDPFNDDGLLTLTDRRPAAPADLSRHQTEAGAAGATLPLLWRQVADEPWRHSLRTWLDFAGMSRKADEPPFGLGQVEARLIAAGHLRRDRKRYVPVEITTANSPAAQLWGVLSGASVADGQAVTLLALAEAAGLRSYLLETLTPRAADCLDWYLQRMRYDPTMKPIADLATQTAAAVGACVLTRS